MIMFLGYFFLSLILSAVVVAVDCFVPGNFLDNFLVNDFISVFATLVGFNIAAIIFLLGQLLDFEIKEEITNVFKDTKKEIKHNIYCLIIIFCASIFLLIFYPDVNSIKNLNKVETLFYYIDKILIISLFILSIFTISEILKAVFKINNFKSDNVKKRGKRKD